MENRTNNLPPKLERFLMTTARRDNIPRMRIALIIINRKRIGLDNERLPKKDVEGRLRTELKALMRSFLLHDCCARYAGCCDDRDGTRQFNFIVCVPDACPAVEFFGLASSLSMLDKEEGKAVRAALRRMEKWA